MKHILSKLIISIIVLYQSTISLLFPGTCRFSPSCSNYMITAINKYGLMRGIYLGCKRIVKCHPFSNSNTWDPA